MNIFLILEMNLFVLIKRAYKFPQLSRLLNLA